MEMLTINHWQIPFHIKKNARAKRLTLKIEVEQRRLVMVVPPMTFKFQINSFLKQQAAWIEKHWQELETNRQNRPKLEHSENYYKNKAKVLIRERLQYFNEFYGFSYNRVSFRNQKTRWGSCSSEKNLNFNWRLILAPLEILDYVVVHELSHLKEMNHSSDFWTLVEKQIPDYKKRKEWLKENHYLLNL